MALVGPAQVLMVVEQTTKDRKKLLMLLILIGACLSNSHSHSRMRKCNSTRQRLRLSVLKWDSVESGHFSCKVPDEKSFVLLIEGFVQFAVRFINCGL